MEGKKSFTAEEVNQIKSLLRKKIRADATQQKSIRSQIRKLGFYISDHALEYSTFRTADFDELISRGAIKIIE